MKSCVEKVMASGKDESAAYAICTASLQDAGQPIFEADDQAADAVHLRLLAVRHRILALSNPEGVNQYTAGGGRAGHFDDKDSSRISGIASKAGGDRDKENALASQMAKSITDPDKAHRRANAAEDQNYHQVAAIFRARGDELQPKPSAGGEHAAKDTERIAGIVTRAGGSFDKQSALAEQMAKSIDSPEKAAARASAAEAAGHPHIAEKFHERVQELTPKTAEVKAETPNAQAPPVSTVAPPKADTGPKMGEHLSPRMQIIKTEGEQLRGSERPLDYGHVNELLREKYGDERGNKQYEKLIDAPGRGVHFVVGTKIQMEKVAMAKAVGVPRDQISEHSYGSLHGKWMAQKASKKLSAMDDDLDIILLRSLAEHHRSLAASL